LVTTVASLLKVRSRPEIKSPVYNRS
jgi:hypothetical protein